MGKIDYYGLRDFIVVIWERDLPSVGHVLVAETNCEVIESNFPATHPSLSDPNVPLSWAETKQQEGREPTDIYQVHLPDDAAATSIADADRMTKTWHWNPTNLKEETNCTVGAYRILKAGKLKNLKTPKFAPFSPDNLRDELQRLSKDKDSGVKRLNGVPWK